MEKNNDHLEFNKRVAVIIPTYNRKTKLIACVNSILEQRYQNFEVVIVDDNSSEAVSLSLFKDGPLRLIRNTINLKQAASRNMAIRSSDADIFILLDDDCWVEDKDWIIKHVNMIREYPRSLVGGRIINKNYNIFGKIRGMMGENGMQFNFLQTMNLSFTKTAYEEIGGFNEKFSELEDVDFSQRALRKSMVLKYDETIICYHHSVDNLFGIMKRQRQYGLWVIPVRKLQKYDGHWILPGSLLSSFVMCMLLPVVITLWQVIMNIRSYPMIALFTPVMWLYNLSYAVGIVSYYLQRGNK